MNREEKAMSIVRAMVDIHAMRAEMDKSEMTVVIASQFGLERAIEIRDRMLSIELEARRDTVLHAMNESEMNAVLDFMASSFGQRVFSLFMFMRLAQGFKAERKGIQKSVDRKVSKMADDLAAEYSKVHDLDDEDDHQSEVDQIAERMADRLMAAMKHGMKAENA